MRLKLMLKRRMLVLAQLSVQIFLYFMPFSATLLLLIFLVLFVSVVVCFPICVQSQQIAEHEKTVNAFHSVTE